MNAIRMLVRRSWRAHRIATLFLAVVAGATAALVGASFQAAARADTSLARFVQHTRVYDQIVQGCPPEVDPSQIQSGSDAQRLCANVAVAERLRKVLNRLPDVERTAVASGLVVGVLDRTVSNHWGRLGLVQAISSPGASLGRGHSLIVEGRFLDPRASDEVMLGVSGARAAGIHAGQTVELAGWHQADLDAGIDGKIAPQTKPFTVKVVGLVRALEDVQTSGAGTLSDASLHGTVYAGPAWVAAHGTDLAGYGAGVVVQLRDGAAGVRAFRAELTRTPGGWQSQAEPISDVSPASPRKVIRLEQRSVLLFAIIGAVAGIAFVGLAAVRQLRREAAESPRLSALGMTRRELRALNITRALTIAAPAAVLATLGILALSPLGPIGLARDLEFSVGIRFDPMVTACTVAAVFLVFAAAGAAVTVGRQPARSPAARPTKLASIASALGPVPTVGASLARGRSTRAAIAVTAVALATGVGATSIVASYDALVGVPTRYGAWWDVAVGQYSEPTALATGVASIRANHNVVAAAGYANDTTSAKLNGHSIRLLAPIDYVGHHPPVMLSGRAPTRPDEVAIGRGTARDLHTTIGDQVRITSDSGGAVRVKVVGIALVNDPIDSQADAAHGAFVRPSVFTKLVGRGTIPQSIVVKVDPDRDRTTAVESLQRDFSGSIRESVPQVDIRNAGRLHAVPWLIAGLVGILAVATLAHALFTMLARNRTTLAVLAALGFTRRQRRGVGVVASTELAVLGILIGVPLGLLLGARTWHAIADSMGIGAAVSLPWRAVLLGPLTALVAAAIVAVVGTRGSLRSLPGDELRVE